MRRPSLEGRVVVVTRPRDRAGELVSRLLARGAVALLAPAIEVSPGPAGALDRAAQEVARGEFAWVVFTSAAGVRALLDRLRPRGGDGAAIRGRVAAVGEGTARALREAGVEPDLVPATFTTAALARGLPRGSGRVLLARADIAPPDLDRAVGAKGWTVVRVDAYRTRPVRRLPARVARALREGRVDAVTFTSASTVEGFARLAGEALRASPRRPAVVCIGPVTAGAARARGLSVDAVARPHTIDGLVAALERVLGPSGGGKESP